MSRPRVFLVHVMKTGGKSLGSVLGSQFEPEACYPNVAGGEGPDVKIFVNALLALDDDRRRSIDFFTVHMPAWVAEHVAPHHTRVTVLREPVSRTISHLRHIARMERTPDDIEEIYDDPEWHGRLTNYQTRIFAMSEQDFEGDRRSAAAFRDLAREDDRRRLVEDLDHVWSTGITSPGELDESHLDRAVARLDRFDEVGLTSELDDLVVRLSRRLGRDLPPPDRLGATGRSAPAPHDLESRIRRDNELDLHLYEHASNRARAGR